MNAPNSGSQLWPAKFKILTFWIRNHDPDSDSIQNWLMIIHDSWFIFLISNRGIRGHAQWSRIRDGLQTWAIVEFFVVDQLLLFKFYRAMSIHSVFYTRNFWKAPASGFLKILRFDPHLFPKCFLKMRQFETSVT